jgi:hypothetical protein
VVFHSALIGNELDQSAGLADNIHVDWKPISTAPYTGELELAVIEKDGPHTVAFPCRRVVGGWIAAKTNKWISVKPTHWRVWPSRKNAS